MTTVCHSFASEANPLGPGDGVVDPEFDRP